MLLTSNLSRLTNDYRYAIQLTPAKTTCLEHILINLWPGATLLITWI